MRKLSLSQPSDRDALMLGCSLQESRKEMPGLRQNEEKWRLLLHGPGRDALNVVCSLQEYHKETPG